MRIAIFLIAALFAGQAAAADRILPGNPRVRNGNVQFSDDLVLGRDGGAGRVVIPAENLDPQAVAAVQVSPTFCPYGQLNGAAVNDACVQKAIDFACTSVNSPASKIAGELVLGRADYYLKGVTVPKSCEGLRFRGQGPATRIISDNNCTAPIINFYPDATQNYVYGGGVRDIHFFNNKPFGGTFDGSTSCLKPLIQANFGRNMTFENLTVLSPATFIKLIGGHHYVIRNISGDQALAGNTGVFEFFGYGATGAATGAYRQDVVDLNDVSMFGASAGPGKQLFIAIWIHGFSSSIRTNNTAFVNASAGLKIDCTAADVAAGLRPAEIGACPAFLIFNDFEVEANGNNAVDISDAQNIQFNYLYTACYARTSTENPSTSGCNNAVLVRNSLFKATGTMTINGGVINNAQASGISYEGFQLTATGGLQIYGNNAANVGASNITIQTPTSGAAFGSHVISGVKFCQGPVSNSDGQRAVNSLAGNDYVVFTGNILRGCGFADPGVIGTHGVNANNSGP